MRLPPGRRWLGGGAEGLRGPAGKRLLCGRNARRLRNAPRGHHGTQASVSGSALGNSVAVDVPLASVSIRRDRWQTKPFVVEVVGLEGGPRNQGQAPSFLTEIGCQSLSFAPAVGSVRQRRSASNAVVSRAAILSAPRRNPSLSAVIRGQRGLAPFGGGLWSGPPNQGQPAYGVAVPKFRSGRRQRPSASICVPTWSSVVRPSPQRPVVSVPIRVIRVNTRRLPFRARRIRLYPHLRRASAVMRGQAGRTAPAQRARVTRHGGHEPAPDASSLPRSRK
jgi:hypothetical protein